MVGDWQQYDVQYSTRFIQGDLMRFGAQSCVACPAGQIDDDSQSRTECTACESGTYAAAGTTECVDCPTGRTDDDDDSSTPCTGPDDQAPPPPPQISLAIPKVARLFEDVIVGEQAAVLVTLQLSVELRGTARNIYAIRSSPSRPLVSP